MGIGDLLLNKNYTPQEQDALTPQPFYFKKIVKCPVEFTDDPIKYATEFLGYKLRPIQKMVLEDLFATDEKGNPIYTEAVFIAGMRSGKSVIGGLVGTFLLQKLLKFDVPSTELGQAPGQIFTGEYIATSEEQSKQTAFSSCVSILNYTTWWRKYIQYLLDREAQEGRETLFTQQQRRISFHEKRLEVASLHSNSASIAGLTAFFVCFDEMSRFDVSDSSIQQQSEKRTAQAVYFTASRAAKTLSPFSKVITITSPMYEDDFGMQLLYKCGTLRAGSSKNIIDHLRLRYPNRVGSMVGYHYSTFEANPKTEENPFGYVEDDFKVDKLSNPEAFSRDYLAIPPSAISPFFDLPDRLEQSAVRREPVVIFQDDIFEEAIVHEGQYITRTYIGKRVIPLIADRSKKYFLCCDQGEIKDSFAIAMGHAEEVITKTVDATGKEIEVPRSKIVIDFVEAWKPDKERKITVSFQNVEEVIRVLSASFYISKVVFDQWSSTESIQRLFSEGVYTEKMGATLEMYDALKMLVYSGMIEMPLHDLLMIELRQLNLIKGKKIDHPPNGSKDLADALCRVVWCVYVDSIRDAIHGKMMLPSGQHVPTVRSIATASEILRQQYMNAPYQYMYAKSGVFPQATPGSSTVFGKGFFVRQNILPNIGKTK